MPGQVGFVDVSHPKAFEAHSRSWNRLFERRHAVPSTGKPKRVALFDGVRLRTGQASPHKTPGARRWRTQLRLMHSRIVWP